MRSFFPKHRWFITSDAPATLDGVPALPQVVVLEFPNVKKATAWYNDPAYTKPGVWALIHVVEGRLLHRILDPPPASRS